MWKKQNIIVKLLVINVSIYLLISILHLVFYLVNKTLYFDDFINFLAVPSDLHSLLTHIWTIFTYMFVHVEFGHILGNMLFLYFLGIIAIKFFDQLQVLTLYFLGGLSGALLYFIGFNIFPVFTNAKLFTNLIGASAAITAMIFAVSAYKPREPIYFFGILKMELWMIAFFMLIWDIAMIPKTNAGGHLAHLGGAIYGLIFALEYKKNVNIQSWAENIISRIFKIGNVSKRKIKVFKSNLKSQDDYTYNLTQSQIRKEIDRILDKISLSGYKSLTKKEKDFLKKFNQKI